MSEILKNLSYYLIIFSIFVIKNDQNKNFFKIVKTFFSAHFRTIYHSRLYDL